MIRFNFLTSSENKKDKAVLLSYLETNKERFNNDEALKFFFKDYDYNIFTLKNYDVLTVVSFKINIPKIYLFFFLAYVLAFIFNIMFFAYILGCLTMVTAIFWTNYYWALITRQGLRNKGYESDIRILNNNKAFNRITDLKGWKL